MILRILKGTFKALAIFSFSGNYSDDCGYGDLNGYGFGYGEGYGDGCVSSVGLGNREARGLTLQSNDKGN